MQRRQAAVAERGGGAENPGPGPTNAQSQPSAPSGVERTLDRDRLRRRADATARAHVAGEHAALEHVRDRVRQLAGQRAAGGLHVADPGTRRVRRERERGAGELAVEREHRDREPLGGRLSSRPSSTGTTACWSDV